MAENTAIIFGISGIGGRALADRLMAAGGWQIVGVSRRRPSDMPSLEHVACDLTDEASTRAALARATPATHLFFVTWSRQPTESENCRVNGAMIRHALDATAAAGRLRHAALVTGLKHYLGSFDNFAKHELDTPFTEDQPRVSGENFYYTQEDILFAAAKTQGFTWSVARPHTVIGYAPGNAMNLGTSLAVYASLCKETERPFVFPGSPQQYGGLVDVTDARLLAAHLLWEATTPAAADKAFNVVNGDVFRWRKMWQRIAGCFGLAAAPYPGTPSPLAAMLADAGPDWDRIVARHGPAADPARAPGALVARRRRSRPLPGNLRRHGPQPRPRLPRLSHDLVLLRRPLRPPAAGADHPVGPTIADVAPTALATAGDDERVAPEAGVRIGRLERDALLAVSRLIATFPGIA